jgi:hypothetical protein
VRGFHVTNLENLDSILEIGILAKDTTKNHFPTAQDNRGERLFFMPTIEASNYWARVHHPNGDGNAKPEDSVIIEFRIPDSVQPRKDPYSWCESTPMEHAQYLEVSIPPSYIVDIHTPTRPIN